MPSRRSFATANSARRRVALGLGAALAVYAVVRPRIYDFTGLDPYRSVGRLPWSGAALWNRAALWKAVVIGWMVASLCSCAQGLSGQQPGARDPSVVERLTYLEATPFFAAVGHHWRIGTGSRALGFEIGGGSLRTVTLVSGGPDFREIVRVGLSGIVALGEATHLDVGVLTGIEDYLLCDDSDCWPDGFVAARAGLLRGRGWLAWGTRLTLARVSGDVVLTWTPVFVRLRR